MFLKPPLPALAPTRLVPIALTLVVLFVAESCRGLVVASLFNYFRVICGPDNKALAEQMNAWAFSSFSVGRLIAGPLMGLACDRFPFRVVFVAACAICLLGHGMYVCVADLDAGDVREKALALVASRFVLGLGSGVLSATRAVISLLTRPDERTRFFSILSLAKFVGYSVTPLLSALPWPSATFGALHVDEHTTPGIILFIANLVLIPLIWLYMDDSVGAEQRDAAAAARLLARAARAAKAAKLELVLRRKWSPRTRRDGASICEPEDDKMLLSSAPGGGSPAASSAGAGVDAASLSTAREASSKSGAPPGGVALAVGGVGGSGSGAVFEPGAAAASARVALIAGVALFLLLNVVGKGILTLCEVVLSPIYIDVQGRLAHEAKVEEIALWFGYLGLGGLGIFGLLAFKTKDVPPPDLVLLVLSFVVTAAGALVLAFPPGGHVTLAMLDAAAVAIWCIGAPIADVLTTSLFSVVIEGKAAGAYMGLLTTAGSVGRIIFPLMTAAAGMQRTLVAASVLSVSCVLCILVYTLWSRRRGLK